MNAAAGTFLESKRAYILFRYSAWWTTLVAGFLAIVAPSYGRIASNNFALMTVQAVGACLGVVGAFAGLIIFFGMLAYLFRRDRSSVKRKSLWLAIFFLTALFESSLYFFLVYRRQVPCRLQVPD